MSTSWKSDHRRCKVQGCPGLNCLEATSLNVHGHLNVARGSCSLIIAVLTAVHEAVLSHLSLPHFSTYIGAQPKSAANVRCSA